MLRKISKIGFGKTIRLYHNIPFLDFYEKTTGDTIDAKVMKKKHPNLESLTYDDIKCTLLILKKYNIEQFEACKHPHIFNMNPINMENYAEILRECGFIQLAPNYIIRYHTLVRSNTISQLKKRGLIAKDDVLEKRLLQLFPEWPKTHNIEVDCIETKLSLLNIRMKILQLYLNWRLGISEEIFQKYCRQYLPMKHRPMTDIQTAIDLAENNIKLDINVIRRNGFIISADPVNTKLIIENVPSLAGLDIREVIQIEPAILKSNYNSLLQVRVILEKYNITNEAQRKCLKIYCLTPKAVQERLDELGQIKAFNILATNPRVVSMIVHKRKMLSRLDKIHTVSKQCYSLNHLVSATKVFNSYITNFGDRACSRDLATLIYTNLDLCTNSNRSVPNTPDDDKAVYAYVVKQLKRHKYCLHVALNVVHENLTIFKKHFSNDVIVRNCHLLMYPAYDIQTYLDAMLEMRTKKYNIHTILPLDSNYLSLNYSNLTDNQIMSLILYELEKKHHFSGDGIWNKSDLQKVGYVQS